MFPLYLLAAQANLGLRRGKQCEDLLGMACWLANKMPEQTTNVMTSQLHRLYGQLYALQGRHAKALEAFATDVFCCSAEHGPLNERTSLGFYNLGKVFQALGEAPKAHANYAIVVKIWLNALVQARARPRLQTVHVLTKLHSRECTFGRTLVTFGPLVNARLKTAQPFVGPGLCI
jgi:tetratricopeptide (TPR) repeat protein